MPNAGQLVDEVLGTLQGYSNNSQQVTQLSNTMGASDLSFTVSTIRSGIMGISTGVVEIDSELIFVSNVGSDGTITIAPFGRGYLGTTATTHASGVLVTSSPTYPRARILDAFNETVQRVFPNLFGTAVVQFTTTYPSITYDLPDTASWVLDARWQPPSPSLAWQGIHNWRISRGGFGTPDIGTAVDVGDFMLPGRPLEFTYAIRPGDFVTEADDFVNVTGLQLSCKDVIVYGACSALVASQELSRLQLSSVEQQDRARLVAPSAALTSSRFLDQKFLTRLAEEVESLRRTWPVRLSGSWV